MLGGSLDSYGRPLRDGYPRGSPAPEAAHGIVVHPSFVLSSGLAVFRARYVPKGCPAVAPRCGLLVDEAAPLSQLPPAVLLAAGQLGHDAV